MLGNSTAPVIIVGMHRSGTSLVTQLLGLMGVHTGDQQSSQYEAYAFRVVNDALLHAAGCDWADPAPFLARLAEPGYAERAARDARSLLEEQSSRFGVTPEGRRWGWKDPRTSITLPVWRAIYPDARVIHVERSGLAVALSVYRRELAILRKRVLRLKLGGRRAWLFPPTLAQAYRVWEIYTRAALAEEPHWASWTTVKYEVLVRNPVDTLCALSDFIGLGFSRADLDQLSSGRVRAPRGQSAFELGRFRLLARLGLVNTDLLAQLGYDRSGAQENGQRDSH